MLVTVRPGIHSTFVLYSVIDSLGNTIIDQTVAKRDVKAHSNVEFSIPSQGKSPVLIKILAVGKAGSQQSAGVYLERGQGPDAE